MSKAFFPVPVRCLVSIDVGVKNLAICMLTQYDSTHSREIKVPFWKWYDVTEIGEFPQGKKKKKPTKKEQEAFGICKSTIKRTGQVCGKKGPVNSRGRAYCGVHEPTTKHSASDTQDWCYAMLNKLPSVGEEIIDVLNTIDGESGISSRDILEIVIEQQSMDNKKIMMQSHLIFGFFVTLFNNAVPIRFVPAYNKLSVYDGPEITCTLKTKYAARKFLARKHTEYFLDTMALLNPLKDFFVSCKTKQDDVADAFLQGLYILIGKPPVAQSTRASVGVKPRRWRKKVAF